MFYRCHNKAHPFTIMKLDSRILNPKKCEKKKKLLVEGSRKTIVMPVISI